MLPDCLVDRDGRYVIEISRDDLDLWLDECGYCRAPEFRGWGEVYAMQPTDDDGRDCGPEEYLAIVEL